jgi:hypothetical protein
VHERFGVRYYFGTDDNFFNHRETAEEILGAMARARTGGRPLGRHIRFGTEATQFDTYRNRDLLPLARAAGMDGIWFGIEDLTATLINKGQKPEVTIELFRQMQAHKISPHAMIMFHDGQPYYSRGSLYGLFNQAVFLCKAGAISFQCTAHGPAVGTREYEPTLRTGRVLHRVGRYTIPECKFDGNHVMVVGGGLPWKRQLQLVGGYAAFYNPWNLIRALKNDGSRLRLRRILYQLAGPIATVWTALKMAPYILRLMTGKLTCYTGPPGLETVPVRRPGTAVPRVPAPVPPRAAPPPRPASPSPARAAGSPVA